LHQFQKNIRLFLHFIINVLVRYYVYVDLMLQRSEKSYCTYQIGLNWGQGTDRPHALSRY